MRPSGAIAPSNLPDAWRDGCIAVACQNCPALRWRLYLVVAAALALFHLLDPFGYEQPGEALSRDIVGRVLAPWYPMPTQEAAAVVVVERDLRSGFEPGTGEHQPIDRPPIPSAEWPPTYVQQRVLLEALIGYCPTAIAIDVSYDSRRAQELTFDELLALVLAERHRVDCPGGPPKLIFADDYDEATPMFGGLRRLAMGEWRIADTVELARPILADECEKAQIGANVADCLAWLDETARQDGLEGDVALAVVTWPSAPDRDSRWYGVESKSFYYLRALDGSRHPAVDDTGRASLALAAYLAHCGAGGSCRHCVGDACAPDWTAAAAGFFAAGASVEAGASGFGRTLGDHLDGPMDIEWRRWAPAANAYLMRYADDPWVVDGLDASAPPEGATRATCHPTEPPDRAPGTLANLGAGLKTLAVSLPGASPSASGRATARCLPLATIGGLQVELVAANRVVLGRGMRKEVAAPPDPWREFLGRLDENLDEALRGKVVFVAFGDLASGDVTRSPIHGTLPGVFYHAMAFDNLVHRDVNYRRAPPSTLFAGSILPGVDIPIGPIKLAEVALILFLPFVGLAVRRRLAAWRWYGRRWDKALELSSRPGANGSALGGVALAYGLGLLGFAVAMATQLALALALALTAYGLLAWSVANWVGVFALSTVPAFLIGFPGARDSLAAPNTGETQDDRLPSTPPAAAGFADDASDGIGPGPDTGLAPGAPGR